MGTDSFGPAACLVSWPEITTSRLHEAKHRVGSIWHSTKLIWHSMTDSLVARADSHYLHIAPQWSRLVVH
jgi:hypothetical protein